jgi:hypothetical protein
LHTGRDAPAVTKSRYLPASGNSRAISCPPLPAQTP